MKSFLFVETILLILISIFIFPLHKEVKQNIESLRKLKSAVKSMYVQNPETYPAGTAPAPMDAKIEKWLLEE